MIITKKSWLGKLMVAAAGLLALASQGYSVETGTKYCKCTVISGDGTSYNLAGSGTPLCGALQSGTYKVEKSSTPKHTQTGSLTCTEANTAPGTFYEADFATKIN